METKRINVLLVFMLMVFGIAQAQSPAALEKLQQRYNADQIAELEQNTHYKYEGLLLFYASSFMVMDNGQARAATEAEIRAVDLNQYNALRQEQQSVSVHDAALGKDLLLLSRDEFEKLVLARLNRADREAYLTYKAEAISLQGKSNQ
jgi:hypothetical protein